MTETANFMRLDATEGVEFRSLGSIARRNKGTGITAAHMKQLNVEGGPVRIFAAGNTVVDVDTRSVPPTSVINEPSVIVKSRGHIGFAYYDKPFTHKSEMWSYTITDPTVLTKFVYYHLLTRVRELEECARATSVKLPQLSVGDTDNLRIPVPPIELQRKIVKVFDSFSELQAKLEAELHARRQQYQYYLDLLVNRAKNAEMKVLADVGTFTRGRRFTNKDFVDFGVGCIHYGEVYTHYGVCATKTKSYLRPRFAEHLRMAKTGDLIIVATGENVEQVCKAVAWLGDDNVAVHDDCYIFRHSLNPKYAAYFFQSSYFNRQKIKYAAGGKMIRVSSDNLEKIRIVVPPLPEQERVVAILDKFDALVNNLFIGLPAELKLRRQQHKYYRDRLLTFREAD